MNTILVVGGAGYIGSHTCKALAQSGFQPITVDNLSTGHREFVRWGPFIQAEMSDAAHLKAIISEHKISVVLHFAASAYVGESVHNPEKYYLNNVAGTLSLLQSIREAGCERIVFSSTCAVYGQPNQMPIVESFPVDPVNPYGASKLMAERILEDYRKAYGLRYFSLRYFNACGAAPGAVLGELRNPETHIIPRAIMSIQGHIKDFAIMGADFDTLDGTAVRDYIHVSDLADAHVTAVKLLLGGHQGGTYNLGTGHGYSVRQVIDEIELVTGRRVPLIINDRRPGDPAVLIADPSLARKELSFVTSSSDLKNIVHTAWKWHLVAHPYCAGNKHNARKAAAMSL